MTGMKNTQWYMTYTRKTRGFVASHHSPTGFSTIEILIAFAVGIIFLSAAMMIAFSDPTLTKQVSLNNGQSVALDTMLDNGGLYRATNNIGSTTKKLAENWNALFSQSTDTTSGTSYTNIPTVTDISPCMKQITDATGWNALGNRSRGITFGTTLSNMSIAKALGPGGCDPTPLTPNSWDNPANTGWDISASQMSGNGSGIAATSISGTPYVFITSWENGNPNKPDLWPVNISNQTSPALLTALNTGKGLKGIAIAGTYAYLIQNDSTNQLQVVDVSNPTNLSTSSIKAQSTLPNMTSAVIPNAITYYNGYIYIGTPYVAFGSALQNHELHIYCVNDPSILNCSPSTPKWMGSYNVNHNVSDISIEQRMVSGTMKTYAFLATSDSTGGYPELTILDVTAPATSITLAGSLNLPSDLYGTSVYALGNRVYLGRQRATGTNNDFYVLDISNGVSTPTILKQKKLGLNPNTAVTKILVHGNLAFLLTSDSNAPFQVWDVITNPTNIVAVNPLCTNTINLPVSSGLAYKNDTVYIVNQNQAAMNTIHDQATTCN
jgi:hypothetical protein